jgi:hypothetical protein
VAGISFSIHSHLVPIFMEHRPYSPQNAASSHPRPQNAHTEQSIGQPSSSAQNPGFFQGASRFNANYSNFIEVAGNHNNVQNIHNIHNHATDPEIEVS